MQNGNKVGGTEWNIQDWQIEIIRKSAHNRGLRGDEIDDAVQEIAIRFRDFAHDQTLAGDAPEKAVFAQFVDADLRDILKQKRRINQKDELWGELHRGEPEDPTPALDLKMDVVEVMESMTDDERRLCALFMKGCSRRGAAKAMGLNKHGVLVLMRSVRLKLTRAGLN